MCEQNRLKAVPLSAELHTGIVCGLLADKENAAALHMLPTEQEGIAALCAEFRGIFEEAERDDDEYNFIIMKDSEPAAWLKLNGFSDDEAWISMLVVGCKRQGVGMYAVSFAEEYIRSKGKAKVKINTTKDNIAANALYRKCGYTLCAGREIEYEDGTVQPSNVYEKYIN